MKKTKDFNQLSISDKMKAGEMLGSKVAKIMNKAKAQADKVLAESGHYLKIEVKDDGFTWTFVKGTENPNQGE